MFRCIVVSKTSLATPTRASIRALMVGSIGTTPFIWSAPPPVFCCAISPVPRASAPEKTDAADDTLSFAIIDAPLRLGRPVPRSLDDGDGVPVVGVQTSTASIPPPEDLAEVRASRSRGTPRMLSLRVCSSTSRRAGSRPPTLPSQYPAPGGSRRRRRRSEPALLRKDRMSLNPWLPVPMTPRVIRSLGATVRPRPSAEPGMIVGKANPAAAAWAVLRRKVRRDGEGWSLGRIHRRGSRRRRGGKDGRNRGSTRVLPVSREPPGGTTRPDPSSPAVPRNSSGSRHRSRHTSFTEPGRRRGPVGFPAGPQRARSGSTPCIGPGAGRSWQSCRPRPRRGGPSLIPSTRRTGSRP